MNLPLDPISVRHSLPGRAPGRLGLRGHSFLLAVVLPTVLIGLFFALIAAPQYVVSFRYSVVSESGAVKNNDILGLSSGTPSKHFDFVVADYALSGQAVADLSENLRLAAMFHPPGYDFIFRFWWDDGSPERLTAYWRNFVIASHFDTYTGIGTVEVRAFSPADAQKIGQTLLKHVEAMVNDLGQPSRETAVRAAREELAAAEARLQAVLKRLAEFRQQQRTYLPSRPADSTEALAASLRQNLAAMNAQLSSLGRALSPGAPAVVNLRSQIAAAEQELERVNEVLGDGGATATAPGARPRMPGMLGAYENIEAERNFALTAHEEALRHLEQVEFNAKVQHLYLHAHARPQLPRSAAAPRPVVWTALAFIGLSTCWMIAMLLFFAMRDHTR